MNASESKPATPLSDQLRASGNWNTTDNWDTIAELDPEWMEKFMQMGMHAMMKKSGLDALTWEFISIAVDASFSPRSAPWLSRARDPWQRIRPARSTSPSTASSFGCRQWRR